MEKYNYDSENERCGECDSKKIEGFDFPQYKCQSCGELQHMDVTMFTGFFTDQQWKEYKDMPESKQQEIYNQIIDRLDESFDEDDLDNYIPGNLLNDRY